MSPIKARWYDADLVALADWGEDPFEVPVEEVGQPIDLGGVEARLQVELVELVRREGNLYDAGVTCAIKDRADTCCHACPVSRAAMRDEELGALCRLGRRQETVLGELAARATCPATA